MKYIDMHCDTIPRLCHPKAGERGETLRKNSGHLDLERMKQGNALAQCFAVFTDLKAYPAPLFRASDFLARLIKSWPKTAV